MHWSQKYIGQPYSEGDHDCAGFAVRVQREVFGNPVELPGHASGVRAQTQQIDNLQNDYATPVDTPIDGDAVLMKSRGRFSHIGIYTEINATRYVVHAMKNAGGVVLHRIRELEHQGLELGGYYRWIT